MTHPVNHPPWGSIVRAPEHLSILEPGERTGGAGASLFGQRVARLEDPDLLTGRARFIDDIDESGMLHAAFVRSPHAHALIGDIHTAAARALRGVHAVWHFADLKAHLRNDRLVVGLPSASYRQERNRPVLAIDEATYVGEPVVVVLAENRYIAEDAAALVEIDWEVLPAISDCRAAMAPGAPRAHRDAPHNLLAEFEIGYGDVDAAFAAAPHIFREHLWQHRGGSHSMEGRGAVARFDRNERRLTLWSSTQMPHIARQLLCGILGHDEEQVRVITPDVGGGFGPKLVFYSEDVVVALAAERTGRAVKWIEDRREHFIATTQERDQYWDIELATDKDGHILGVRGDLLHDHGAYTARGVNLPYESAQTVTLAYDVPAYRLSVKLALTNKVPVTPVRGAGQPQGAFAMERLLDRAARELGLERDEIRRRNLIAAERMPFTKELQTRGGIQVVLDSGDYPGCMRAAQEAARWESFPARQKAARAEGRHLGIGLANFVKGTGRGPFEPVTVRIAPSGRIHVFTGAAAMGQGTRTMLAQLVADQLGADMNNITVICGDTAGTTLGLGGFNSRQAVIAGTSAHLAAIAVRDKALAVASHALEVSAEDLEIRGDEVGVKGVPGLALKLGKIATMLGGVAGFRLPAGLPPGLEATEAAVIDAMSYANGTAIVEIEVDIETGATRIENFVFAHDCGRIIHPGIVDGQVLGGIVHGIGNALFEWMGYDENAQPVTTNFGEYLLPTATELPRITLVHQTSPTPLNPLGVKGVGECGVVPTAAAIVSAIEDALSPFGAHLSQAPLSPADILAAISLTAAAR
jgi:aerobic carbon-monoxide dehydrogenase large subunit